LANDESGDKLKTVTARDIQLQVPEAWQQGRPSSSMRAAQFTIPNPEKQGDSAELVVFYFGGPTGGIQSNLQRWIGQFSESERKVDVVTGKCRDGSYVLADISGTWKKPIGPPMLRKTVDAPGSRVIGVILIQKKENAEEDYYFLKLSGPDELVRQQADALRKAFGADPGSEQPRALEGDAD
jgi:gluconolactonase